jgi:hypothetical protein
LLLADLVDALTGIRHRGLELEAVLFAAVERNPRMLWACQDVTL